MRVASVCSGRRGAGGRLKAVRHRSIGIYHCYNGMPEKHRLPNFDVTSLKSANDAYNILRKVAARRQCPLPIIKPPVAYVEKLKERLRILAKAENENDVRF